MEALRALTFWRGRVMKVVGKRYVWHVNVPAAGGTAVFAAVFALAACYPAAHSLLSLLGRRLRDDGELPPALPFGGALVATALWLLPLCYLHPTTLFSSPVAITWLAVGSLLTLGLFAGAWHTTCAPGTAAGTTEKSRRRRGRGGIPGRPLPGGHRLQPARLRHPHRPGRRPSRGGARSGPVRGETDTGGAPHPQERTARPSTDPVDRRWDVAEFDDAGTPVRLAAEPADLARVLRGLDLAKTSVNTANPGQ
ncbi:hypothetical protein [Streptomyces sp. NPDC000994]